MNGPALATTTRLSPSIICGGFDDGAGDMSGLLAPMCRAVGIAFERLPSREYNHTLWCGQLFNRTQLLDLLGMAAQPMSDTDVLTRACLTWGVGPTLSRISGKFALAHWNAERQTLTLACDRTTEFTLFYGRIDGRWVFSSDFAAFRPLHGHLEIDRQALALFVRYGFVPAPHSLYREVRKLLPGHWVSLSALAPHAPARQQPYAPSLFACQPRPRARISNEQGAVVAFERLLLDAIEARLAGGSVGAFMSSGFDSTLGAALLQKTCGQAIDTFTVGFHGMHCNEAPAAKAIARHLGSRHHEIYLDDQALATVVQDIPGTYGEPLADSSQLPSMLLARAARERVTQVFAGDGADCVLGEYAQRLDMYRGFLRAQALGPQLKRVLVQGLPRLDRCCPRLGRAVAAWLAQRLSIDDMGRDAVEDVCGVLAANGLGQVEQTLGARILDPARLVLGAEPVDIPWPGLDHAPRLSVLLDQLVQVQGEILLAPVVHKTTAACAAQGLQVAMPFLDVHVLGYAGGLAQRLKYRKKTSKWLLRQVAYRHIPPALLDRPKLGFSIWLSPLLRGPLRGWAEDLLAPERLSNDGFFDAAQVRREWNRLLYHGENFREERLWSILMFQQWLGTCQTLPNSLRSAS
ncbi:asparagine synthetase B family protein [Pseudomonas lactucae]|uniref:asparagine synthase (glutamine-hydrolyzing) n=1 Tax=Pseudomonas lactucae TaxID=2813360 RepID=A0A9X0Y9T4_9PSED|nr:asparagine synthase C-terminal domain-containing protein [Pseudomonas lactucae]MBN2975661.1 hypothetical protein [Pseudomonas lactucae]